MRTIAAAALCALLAGPALTVSASAESVGEKTGVNSLIGIAPSTQDFVSQSAVSNLFETQTSQLALERGDDKTKAFAKKMIDDHKQAGDELKTVVETGKIGVQIPTQLDSAHQSKLDKLKGLQGNDFNKQYQDDQLTAHKNAVDLFKRYGDGGENEPLKAYARKTQPHLEEHLKLAQDLAK